MSDKLTKAPVLIRLNPEAVYSVDLEKEIQINKHKLDHEIRNQASKYIWWAGLLSEVSYKVSVLEVVLERMEAALYKKYEARGYEVQWKIKNKIKLNLEYQKAQDSLMHWKRSEVLLKYAEKAFSERGKLLQSTNANHRKEWDSK